MPLQMWDLRALEENVLKIIIEMKLNMNNSSIVDFFPLLFSLDCLMHEIKKKNNFYRCKEYTILLCGNVFILKKP